MADETETTVTVESAPAAAAAAEVAASAANAALIAAESVQQQSNALAAQQIENANAEIRDQKESFEWLHEHANATTTSLQSLSQETATLRQEQQELKTGMGLMLEKLSSLILPAPETAAAVTVTEATPPNSPNEGAADSPAAETKKKRRRLI